MVKFYTGLPNLKVLQAIYIHILPGIHESGKTKCDIIYMKDYVLRPDSNALMKTMPACFQVSFGKKWP